MRELSSPWTGALRMFSGVGGALAAAQDGPYGPTCPAQGCPQLLQPRPAEATRRKVVYEGHHAAARWAEKLEARKALVAMLPP